jgi:hypothetical protein
VTESEEEIDSDGFTTVRTRKMKQAIKRSKKVNERSALESQDCKVASSGILLKQCCNNITTDSTDNKSHATKTPVRKQ